MASAEELIQAAYFELQNVAPGATDERRRRSRATRLANRILRKYPVSAEARQARSILRQLKIDDEVRQFADTHSHGGNVNPLATPSSHTKPEPRSETHIASANTDWKSLWLLFTALSYLQKRILVFVLLFIALFVAFTPFVLIFAFLLFIKRDAIRPLVHRILVAMNPDATHRGFRNG